MKMCYDEQDIEYVFYGHVSDGMYDEHVSDGIYDEHVSDDVYDKFIFAVGRF